MIYALAYTVQLSREKFNNRAIVFLVHSILTLSALYITDDEAKMDPRFDSAKSLSNHYAAKARIASQKSSDQPSVPTIQANLCLGLRELIAWTDCKAWMYIGLATRMAQAARMRMEYNHRHCPRQREVRRRTFWACVILDRFVAYCTFRTQTIETVLVSLHLPCSNVAFAFGHDRPGPSIEGIATETVVADVLPFFVKTLIIWSDIAAHYVNRGRRWAANSPLDSSGKYQEYESTLKEWCQSIPNEIKWSLKNLHAHQSLGQELPYIEMHFLIQHAGFVVYQEYLPQTEELSTMDERVLLPQTDKLGIPFSLAEPQVITACVYGAKQILEMIQMLQMRTTGRSPMTPSVVKGTAMVTAASIFLWVQYASEKTLLDHSLEIGAREAKDHFDFLYQTLDAWTTQWKLARSWCTSLRLLEVLYRTVYVNEIEPSEVTDDTQDDTREPGPEEQPGAWLYRPREGDGLPDASLIPQGFYYKARIITGLATESSDLCKRILRLAAQRLKESNWLSEALQFSEDLWLNDFDFAEDIPIWDNSPSLAEDLLFHTPIQ